MTIREATIAKLQRLPEPLLQQVSDFIDCLTHNQQSGLANEESENLMGTAWVHWFESVDCLESPSVESVDDYHQLLITKYRQQGLNL